MNKAIFWSNPEIDINKEENLPYVVHQTLVFGELDDIAELKGKLGLKKMQQVFLQHPMPIYTKASLNFAKNFILHLKEEKIPPEKYVKTVF